MKALVQQHILLVPSFIDTSAKIGETASKENNEGKMCVDGGARSDGYDAAVGGG